MFRGTHVFTCLFFSIFVHRIYAARILCVFPIPSFSHQTVLRAYAQELAQRGHELVILTTHPELSKDRPQDNIKEVDLGLPYEKLMHLDHSGMKHGVVYGPNVLYKVLLNFLVEECHHQLQQSAVKKILEDNSEHFDLIVLDAVLDCPLIVSTFINAPVIQISTFYGTSSGYAANGAPAGHPLLFPDYARTIYGDSFLDKLKGVYEELTILFESRKLERREDELLKLHFGPGAPTIHQLRQNVDLLFVNSHPIFVGNRPVTPSIVYLGPFHLQKVKELPKDIKTFLDNSKRGVVYVSFGTNVATSIMDQVLKDMFLKAFGSLNYDVVWKFDGEKPTNVPKNVRLQSWFPQRDLLTHANIRAFVTQGGRQSLDEAIDAGVPLVGIPFFGDQAMNVQKVVELGMGIKIDPLSFTPEELAAAVNRVIDHKSYRANVEKIRTIVNDEPQTAMERAMWWTEHILRHKGGRHLRAPGANMTWAEYLMLDVMGPVLTVLFTVTVASCTSLYFTLRKLRSYLKGATKLKTT